MMAWPSSVDAYLLRLLVFDIVSLHSEASLKRYVNRPVDSLMSKVFSLVLTLILAKIGHLPSESWVFVADFK